MSNVKDIQNESGHQDFTLQMKEFSESEDMPKVKVLSPKSLPTSAREYGITLEGTLRTSAREENPLIFKEVQNLKEKEKDITIDKGKSQEKQYNKDGKEENGEEKEEDEDYQYYLLERSKKLRNSKNHKKHVVISQISTFALIFIAFFIVDYVLERVYLTSYQDVIMHMGNVSRRIPDLRYVHTFTYEELVAGNLSYVYPNRNF